MARKIAAVRTISRFKHASAADTGRRSLDIDVSAIARRLEMILSRPLAA